MNAKELRERLSRSREVGVGFLAVGLVSVVLGIFLERPFQWTSMIAQDRLIAAGMMGANVLVWTVLGMVLVLGYRRWYTHE